MEITRLTVASSGKITGQKIYYDPREFAKAVGIS